MRRFSAIFFDLDGVIADSIAVTEQAFCHAYRTVMGSASTPPFEEYKRHLGKGLYQILDSLSLPHAMHDPFVAESERLLGSIKPTPGIDRVLAELESLNVMMGIATGKSTRRALQSLDSLGFRRFFPIVVGYDAVVAAKPAPDMIYTLLGHFRARPQEAVMIGDSPADILAAHGAGVSAAAAMWGDGAAEQLAATEPDFVLQAPPDILTLISQRS
jgi:AHBA synthesis associated protein